jgi:hypothetical protein
MKYTWKTESVLGMEPRMVINNPLVGKFELIDICLESYVMYDVGARTCT